MPAVAAHNVDPSKSGILRPVIWLPCTLISVQCAAQRAILPRPEPQAAWLDDVVRDYARQTVLVVGHRATFYALEHLINAAPLRDAVLAPWQWQPGWLYLLKSRLEHRRSDAAVHDARLDGG